MPTSLDVAKWMQAEVQKGALYQDDAADRIKRIFGSDFVYMNDGGGTAISKKALRAFNKLTKDDVVWSRYDRMWRPREPTDAPGRMQD